MVTAGAKLTPRRGTVAHLGNQGCCVYIHTGNLSPFRVADQAARAAPPGSTEGPLSISSPYWKSIQQSRSGLFLEKRVGALRRSSCQLPLMLQTKPRVPPTDRLAGRRSAADATRMRLEQSAAYKVGHICIVG